MMKFLQRLKARAPEYPVKYYDTVISRFSLVGGKDKDLAFSTGKSFENVYEIYMYALILGLRKDYKLPVEGLETRKFIEIRSWQPIDVVDYIILSVLARSGLDLNQIEDLEEKDIEGELTNLKKTIEQYAHGGLDLIENAINTDPHRFENDDFVFVTLLDEL